MDRRDFIKKTGAAITVIAGAGVIPISEAATFTRKDINSLKPDSPEVKALIAGVKAMKAMGSADPRNWIVQADIHNAYCPHGNWFFLPWHRAYVYFFEAVCREASGDKNFALPYWNWTSDPTVPALFWDKSSPLYHAKRYVKPSDKADSSMVGKATIERILKIKSFSTFGGPETATQKEFKAFGELEGAPHNHVHIFTGGCNSTTRPCPEADMGDMGRVPLAPRDPIFWLHHCNIDRLWESWNQCYPNISDKKWLNFDLDRFYDVSQKKQRSIKVSSLLSSAGLGYGYDRLDPKFAACSAAQKKAAEKMREIHRFFLRGLKAAEKWWDAKSIWSATGFAPYAGLAKMSFDGQSVNSVTAQINKLSIPQDPATIIRVFLNHPGLTTKTPASDPHYVASFTFFGQHNHGGGQHSTTVSMLVDLTQTIHSLTQAGKFDPFNGQIDVQLQPVLPGGDARAWGQAGDNLAAPESIEIVISGDPEPFAFS